MPPITAEEIREVRQWMEQVKQMIDKGVVISPEATHFVAELDGARTERDITPWLKKNPAVLGRLANARYPHVFQGVPIGTKHPDFVVLDSFSGGWDVTMIELEPPSARLFTKSGNPAQRLAGAITQVEDWRNYVLKHRQEVLTRLAEYYMQKDLTGGKKHGEPTDCGGIPLADVRSSVIWNYYIVIGRRRNLTPDEMTRKAGYFEQHRIRIATYDRLVAITDRLNLLPYSHY